MADIDSNLPVRDFSDGSTGSAVPSSTQQVGGSDGTNLRTLSTDTTGKLNINNISGTVALPTGAATSANQTNASQKTQVVDGSGNIQPAGDIGARAIFTSSKISLTGSSPATATIGVSSGAVIAANANRKGLVIVNTSTISTVSLNVVAGTAVLDSGITLTPHGTWTMDEYTFTTAAINGIASLASTILSIQEFT